jgi:hypothetical protein
LETTKYLCILIFCPNFINLLLSMCMTYFYKKKSGSGSEQFD